MNSNWQCHKNYTQNDWFREGYIDTSAGDWSFRLGKQQVVWGTADGIKLLDIINPTDFREMAQNSMEDSRIPIWMINAERNIGETGNVQFILSENRKNVIPGLNDDNRNFDSGHPFIMKGVDSITGRVNGFLHVTPALASVAGSFNAAAFGGMFTGGQINPAGLLPFAGMTVDYFAQNMWTTQQLPIPQDMPGYFILRCPPWRAKRRRVVPGSREATRDTRRAEGAKGDPKGASERGVQSYGRPVCSRNELAMLWRNAG